MFKDGGNSQIKEILSAVDVEKNNNDRIRTIRFMYTFFVGGILCTRNLFVQSVLFYCSE